MVADVVGLGFGWHERAFWAVFFFTSFRGNHDMCVCMSVCRQLYYLLHYIYLIYGSLVHCTCCTQQQCARVHSFLCLLSMFRDELRANGRRPLPSTLYGYCASADDRHTYISTEHNSHVQWSQSVWTWTLLAYSMRIARVHVYGSNVLRAVIFWVEKKSTLYNDMM